MLRAVLDANIIISALIRPDSAPGRIMRAAIRGTHLRMVTSDPLLCELRAALAYKRLQRFLKMSPREQDEFVVVLEQVCDLVSITGYQALAICRDPKDEPYLLTARAGRAEFIVSGDKDLLVLQFMDHVPIIGAAAFDRILRGANPESL